MLFVLAQADYNCINQGSPVKQNKIGDRDRDKLEIEIDISIDIDIDKNSYKNWLM